MIEDSSSEEDVKEECATMNDRVDQCGVEEESESEMEEERDGSSGIKSANRNVGDMSSDDENFEENIEDDGDNNSGVDFSDSEDNDIHGNANEDDKDSEKSLVKVAANPAWAQAMAKILRTNKPMGKKSVVLSKARTIPAAEAAAAKKLDEPDFEIVGEKEVKHKIKTEEDIKPSEGELIFLAKRAKLAQCRIRQEDFDYNRERALMKIATKGVVQLFNAVRTQQKTLGSKLAEVHSTRMEDKLLKSIDKDSFLEHLTGKIRSHTVDEVAKTLKKEKVDTINLPRSWDELSKKVDSGSSSNWNTVIEVKDEPDD